jgi:hypothetical protein
LKISILFEKNIKNPVALCCVKESILIEEEFLHKQYANNREDGDSNVVKSNSIS